MKGIFAVVVATLVGTSAVHAEPIWRDLDSSMTERDVASTLGKKQKCVEVQHYYDGFDAIYWDAPRLTWDAQLAFAGPGKTLNRVTLSWYKSNGVTADMVEQDLKAKYGNPLTRDDYRNKETIGFIRPMMRVDEPRLKMTWKRGDVLITLDRQTDSFDFTLTYEVIPNQSLGL